MPWSALDGDIAARVMGCLDTLRADLTQRMRKRVVTRMADWAGWTLTLVSEWVVILTLVDFLFDNGTVAISCDRGNCMCLSPCWEI